MMQGISEMTHAAAGRIVPVWKSLERNARSARHAVSQGRDTVERFTTDSADRIRRYPFTAVAVAGLAGLGAGCLMGLLYGRRSAP